jgi:hypothetical protein
MAVISLPSYQQWARSPFLPVCQHVLRDAILISVTWYVLWLYFFFSADKWGWEFSHLPIHHACRLLRNVCSGSLHIFMWLISWAAYRFLILASYQIHDLEIFSPNLWVVSLLLFPLLCRRFLVCCNSIFAFVACTFGVKFRKFLPQLCCGLLWILTFLRFWICIFSGEL